MDNSQFDLHAQMEDVHWWFRARREIIFDQLSRHVPPGEGQTIAEIGCGTGGNLKFLQEHFQVVGTDISPEAVAYASARVGCRVLLGDFREQLAGRWGELDGVVLLDVLEHIDDDTRFLADLLGSMRPGAVLLLTVPAHAFLWSHHDVVLGHKRRYCARALRKLWEGLAVEELFFSPFNCLLFPVIALKRLLAGNGAPGKSDLAMPAPWLNSLLYQIFSAERGLLRALPLPFGLSYLAILRKR
ncbi:MAG: class I SAM-dependent methyltransferase [Geobacteraceae bacterium]|nr:class I SAM-dependent methyltransferase [Geobacteraceae bacterium]